MIVVQFITRRGCHLCTDALLTVREVLDGAADASLEIVDVDTDPALQDEWGWDVPVVLVDGEQFAKWRVDAAALRARLGRDRDGRP